MLSPGEQKLLTASRFVVVDALVMKNGPSVSRPFEGVTNVLGAGTGTSLESTKLHLSQRKPYHMLKLQNHEQ